MKITARILKRTKNPSKTFLLVTIALYALSGSIFAQSPTVTIKSDTEVPEPIQAKAEELKKNLSSWKYMRPSRIEFSYADNTLEVTVVPASFTYEGRDLLRYLKSGIRFYYRDALEYDFRIFIDKMFLKVKGFYTEEEAFCKNLLNAIEDPKGYLRSRDPEFMLARIEKMQKDLDGLSLKMHQLEQSQGDLRKQFDTARKALIALHNTGFFSGPSKVSDKVIERVVALKKAEPSLKADQIAERLEKEKIEASSKEVELILTAFFYELDD